MTHDLKKKDVIQGTSEWLNLRKKFIGASDAPVIMGVSPWKTPYQLWEEKLQLICDEDSNSYMVYGIETEEKARKHYQMMAGIIVEPKVVFHQDYEWMMASLDGITAESDWIVEIKCPGEVDHKSAQNGEIPKKYYPQLQHQLEVCGLDQMHYFSYRNGEGVIVEVKRDQAYIDEMIVKHSEFWKCVTNFIQPNKTQKDYVDKENLEGEEELIWIDACNSWKQSKSDLEIAKQKEKIDRDRLIKLANGQSCKFAGVFIRKIINRGSVQYDMIPELENVDLDIYRGEDRESWRIS